VVAASRSLKLAALVAPPFAYAPGVRHSNRSLASDSVVRDRFAA